MAIKVNGTTVIDDSRNLQSVQGIKTINNTSILGSGNISAGASTTAGAVGTYGLMQGFEAPSGYFTNSYSNGSTISGSLLRFASANAGSFSSSPTPSGTWRCMGGALSTFSSSNATTLWVRIS